MTTEEAMCTHHWILPTPEPPFGAQPVKATCKKCGDTKSQPSYYDDPFNPGQFAPAEVNFLMKRGRRSYE